MVLATCGLHGFYMREISLELLIPFPTRLLKHHHVLLRTLIEGQILLLENQEFVGGDRSVPGKVHLGEEADDGSLERVGDDKEKIFPGHHEGHGVMDFLEHRRGEDEEKRFPEQTEDAGKQWLECCTGVEGWGPKDLQQCPFPPGGHLC